MNKIISRFFFLPFFLFIANCLIAQNNNIDLDALKYLNTYLSEKSIIDDEKGELLYDKYSNSLIYSSTTIMYENPTIEKDIYFRITVNFPIPLDGLSRIVETILQQGKDIVVAYEFYLNEDVKRTIQTKKRGEWLDEKTTNTNKVFFAPAKTLTMEEIKKLNLVMRDVFPNIQIETERKYN